MSGETNTRRKYERICVPFCVPKWKKVQLNQAEKQEIGKE